MQCLFNYESLENVDNLDTLLMEIRGKTISYATFKKREKVRLENNLVSEIRSIEENLNNDMQFEALEEKKGELRLLRQDKVRGQYIRSRTQWAEEGEKPTHFFCNLENRNYINKTIPRLISDNGTNIEDQNKILEEAQCFYKKLYSKQNDIIAVNLDEKIPYTNIPKLSDTKKISLEGAYQN